jgi:hypothetical protein
MKNLIFLFIVVLITTMNSYAQCKYKRNEKDSFTGQLIKETKPFSLAMGLTYNYTFSLRKIDTSYYVLFFYATTGYKGMVIPGDGQLMFKLNNDKVMVLYGLKISISDLSNNTGMATTELNNIYTISQEDLEQLQINEISILRFYTTEGYLEKETSTNGRAKFKENVHCILN